MIGRFYFYFGIVGILSVAVWLAAWAAFAVGPVIRKRTRFFLAALALAACGLLLARINSTIINNIEVDYSEQETRMKAHQERVREEAREKLLSRAADIRFAEDNPDDRLDLAGVKKDDDARKTYETSKPEPAYRRRGKQQRADGKQTTEPSELIEGFVKSQSAPGRKMTPAQIAKADRYDRLNLFAARLTLWVAFALVIFDYLSRFNKTLGAVFPLPIAGRAADSFLSKVHSAYLHKQGGPGAVREFLERTIRKGETFIYLGPSDPWETDTLYRIRLGRLRLSPIRKIACRDSDVGRKAGFVFESAWFGRHYFVVVGREASEALLPGLLEQLRLRHASHAAAWRTVNLVWDFDAPEPQRAADELEELVFLCREANFRLILAGRKEAPPADIAPLFEETLPLSEASFTIDGP